MKKGISIVALSITAIALMLSILIPHHHNDDGICFIAMHASSDCNSDSHGDANHNHDADGTEDHRDCVLDIEVIVPSNHVRTQVSFISFTDVQKEYNVYSVLAPGQGIQEYISCIRLNFSPLIRHHFSNPARSSQGLRAPPYC